MGGSLPLVSWFVGALAAILAVLTVTGYAVYTRRGGHHRLPFPGLVGIECCWVLAAIAQSLAGKYAASLAVEIIYSICTPTGFITINHE